jgi:hypothetical protein
MSSQIFYNSLYGGLIGGLAGVLDYEIALIISRPELHPGKQKLLLTAKVTRNAFLGMIIGGLYARVP